MIEAEKWCLDTHRAENGAQPAKVILNDLRKLKSDLCVNRVGTAVEVKAALRRALRRPSLKRFFLFFSGRGHTMGAGVLCRFCCALPCSANVSPDVQRVQGLLRMVEAAKPIQKLGTPCQSCGLKALTNLRCSRWSAAALTRAPRCRQAQQNPSLTPCRVTKN